MPRDSSQHHIHDHLSVISLKRTPQRLKDFFRRNSHCLKEWNVHIVDGIDGNQQKELFKQARLISNNVLNEWSPGAIGSALSHMHSWRLCMQLGKPIIVVEDDTILAKELDKKLQTLLEKEKSLPPFLLLGWNLDSLLQAEFEPGMELISLFEPAYPDEFAITRLVNCKTERKMGKLKRCFGLPAYRITPNTAEHLLKRLNPLVSEEIRMGRGIPTHFSETLDGALNNQYETIGAKITFPPLAIALNCQDESLTRKREPQKFQE